MGRVAAKKAVVKGSRKVEASGERVQPDPSDVSIVEALEGGRREQNKLDKRLRIRDAAAELFEAATDRPLRV